MNRPSSFSPHDDRNVRHGCGFRYNGYAWPECPRCRVEGSGGAALRCISCRHAWFAGDQTEMCPECGSGETSVIAVDR